MGQYQNADFVFKKMRTSSLKKCGPCLKKYGPCSKMRTLFKKVRSLENIILLKVTVMGKVTDFMAPIDKNSDYNDLEESSDTKLRSSRV